MDLFTRFWNLLLVAQLIPETLISEVLNSIHSDASGRVPGGTDTNQGTETLLLTRL